MLNKDFIVNIFQRITCNLVWSYKNWLAYFIARTIRKFRLTRTGIVVINVQQAAAAAAAAAATMKTHECNSLNWCIPYKQMRGNKISANVANKHTLAKAETSRRARNQHKRKQLQPTLTVGTSQTFTLLFTTSVLTIVWKLQHGSSSINGDSLSSLKGLQHSLFHSVPRGTIFCWKWLPNAP